MAEELDAELVDIKEELALIEGQLSSLLERQHQLMKKKRHLEDSLRLTADAGAHESAAVQWDKEVFPWSKNLVKARNSVFKLDSFRPLQLQTMNATLSGKDVILIMPTGAGKSLCFQLPAIVSQGVTLVVSPLVSLMEDQTMSLRNVDGITAQMLCASTPKEDVKLIQDDMTSSKSTMNLLYVTPEKLAKSKRFMSKLEKMYSMGRLARLVIDEVHCCSQWGHDFRPDYKFLGIMKRQFPKTPILGLTATATTNVLEDVKKILQIPRCLILKASFNRANLFYEVHAKPSSSKEMVDTLVTAITTRFTQQSGIIYCLSQKDSEDVASKLKSCGIESGCYHANLSPSYRSRIHKDWISGVVQVVVATTAFGMGIDKPDVRFVIHHSISKSMENYYQESGRAGRDDKPAHCILYCGFGDVFRLSTMVMSEQTGIDNLYAMLRYAYNTSRCRRSLIAQFFNATWDSSDCAKMCDHCQTQGESVKKDLSSYGRDLSAILAQAQSRKLQVTALKLLDAWMGRGGVPLQVDGVKPPADKSRAHAERVIVHLLVLGYLKEEYHFTPYSTISYLVQGPKSTMLQNPNHTILVDWPSTSQSKTGKPTSRKPKSSVQLPKPKSRPKKVSSAATNPVFFSEEDFDEGMEDGGSCIQNGHTSYEDKSSEPHPKKRRTHLVVSDSDSDWDVSELEPVLSEVQRKSTAVAKGDIKVIELT